MDSLKGLLPVAAALLLCTCATAQESPTAIPFVRSVPATPPSAAASEVVSAAPTSDSGVGELHLNAAQAWSIVVPTGWEVVADSANGTALNREQVIAEILVAPSSGLTFEELEAQQVGYLRTWPGVDTIESGSVRLPAGDALRLTMTLTEVATSRAAAFILYVIEEGDTQYLISVRGPHDKEYLLTEAEALAESFVILD